LALQQKCPGVPVPLAEVGRACGVNRVLEVAGLGNEGLSYEMAGAREIRLRASLPAGRRRFTLAHEIGHAYLRSVGLRGAWLEEERWCNRFAAALLLPRSWLLVMTRAAEPCIQTLDHLACEASVSVHAVIWRLSSLRAWPTAAIWARVGPDGIRIDRVHRAGLVRSTGLRHGQLVPEGSVIAAAAVRPNVTCLGFESWITARARGEATRGSAGVLVEARAEGAFILALLHLQNRPASLPLRVRDGPSRG
jgi:hypothetical protein